MITIISPVLELVEVEFGYDATPVVDGLSLRIDAGTHTALIGPNGSGKSTVLALAARILSPQTGSVDAGRSALVPQRSDVNDRMPITVRETVTMGRWAVRGAWRRIRRIDHDLVDETLDRLGISALAQRRLGSLSGGQRQRALIAQALVQQAPLLLLDEPEAGLDVEVREIIARVLREETSRGTAVIVATHEARTAMAADRVLLLREGRCVVDGLPEQVLDRDALAKIAFGN